MPKKNVTISALKRVINNKAKKNSNGSINSTRKNNAIQAAKYRINNGKGKGKKTKSKKIKNKK
jgi:hypothetical protein